MSPAMQRRIRKREVPGKFAANLDSAFRCAEYLMASGGNDLAVLLQASDKALQGAVAMRAAALDEEGIDPRLRRAERVDADVAALIIAFDDRARQQRDAHAGGDAADHAIERSQLEAG